MRHDPHNLPADNAPDYELVGYWWALVQSDPRWLTGLRRPDGRPYLERQAIRQPVAQVERVA